MMREGFRAYRSDPTILAKCGGATNNKAALKLNHNQPRDSFRHRKLQTPITPCPNKSRDQIPSGNFPAHELKKATQVLSSRCTRLDFVGSIVTTTVLFGLFLDFVVALLRILLLDLVLDGSFQRALEYASWNVRGMMLTFFL